MSLPKISASQVLKALEYTKTTTTTQEIPKYFIINKTFDCFVCICELYLELDHTCYAISFAEKQQAEVSAGNLKNSYLAAGIDLDLEVRNMTWAEYKTFVKARGKIPLCHNPKQTLTRNENAISSKISPPVHIKSSVPANYSTT